MLINKRDLRNALQLKAKRLGTDNRSLVTYQKIRADRLAKARENPVSFCEFVMRSETTQRLVYYCAPHQQVALMHAWENKRSVQIRPINHAKTFDATTLALFMIGKYPNKRGLIVSRVEKQAKKILSNVGRYIKHSPEFQEVFPWVLPGEKWTDSELIVKRETGMKDPTCAAFGLDSHGKLGFRADWIIADDILDSENTATQEQRNDNFSKFKDEVVSRIEHHDESRFMVSNSAWHPDDILHRLEAQGWATLRMQVDGSIYVKDDASRTAAPWDHPLLMPHPLDQGDPMFGEKLALVGWQPGDMLWKNHPTIPSIEYLHKVHPITQEFNRLYMSMCRDDGSSLCKAEWIEKAKQAGERAGYHSLVHRSNSGNPRVTGVDLAVQPGEHNDDTCIFTFEVLPDGRRLIVDIVIGKMDGPQIVDAIADAHDRYNSLVAVENNAAQQFIIDFMRKKHKHVPVKHHMTGRNKAHPQHGIVTIFTEIAQGLWVIPHKSSLPTHPNIQRLVNECLYYVPHKHTGDVLMAMWIARELARKFGLLRSGADGGGSRSGRGMSMNAR